MEEKELTLDELMNLVQILKVIEFLDTVKNTIVGDAKFFKKTIKKLRKMVTDILT